MKLTSVFVALALLAILAGSNWRFAEHDVRYAKPEVSPLSEQMIYGSVTAPAGKEFTLVPQFEAPSFDDQWSTLRKLTELYLPIDRSRSSSPGTYLMTRKKKAASNLWYLAAYSDSKLFTSATKVHTFSPLDLLLFTLFDTKAQGLSLNPRSRVMSRNVRSIFLEKTDIAELVGFLEVGEEELSTIPFSKLALAASAENKAFEVLYYWRRSYSSPRSNDDWKQAELAKIKALIQIDYPGARQKAVSELKWFIDTYGPTHESVSYYKRLISSRY